VRAVSILSSILVAACSACSGPASNPDAAPPDATPPDAGDAGQCPGALFLTGAYVDWDSTAADFHGVAFATWQLDASHTDQTAPNGRVLLCIPATGRSLIQVTSMSGDAHLNGHFIADAAVFADGRIFSARGITAARAESFLSVDHSVGDYDPGKADLFVQQTGTPVALTLTGATAAATLTSPDGITWTPGTAPDVFTLFANVSVTGTPHLAGPATGAGDVPMVNGELTMTTVIGQ
jgi:hypothetical protein